MGKNWGAAAQAAFTINMARMIMVIMTIILSIITVIKLIAQKKREKVIQPKQSAYKIQIIMTGGPFSKQFYREKNNADSKSQKSECLCRAEEKYTVVLHFETQFKKTLSRLMFPLAVTIVNSKGTLQKLESTSFLKRHLRIEDMWEEKKWKGSCHFYRFLSHSESRTANLWGVMDMSRIAKS